MSKEELYKKRSKLLKELSKVNDEIRNLEYDGKDYSGKFIKRKTDNYTQYMKVKIFHALGDHIQFVGKYFDIDNESEEIIICNNHDLLVSTDSVNDEVEIISEESYLKILSETLNKFYESQVNN